MKKHIFQITHKSDIDDKTYQGTFSSRKLSVRDMTQLNVKKAQLNGGLYYDPDNPGVGIDSGTDNFNHMIAHLELAVVDRPDWWNLDEIGDMELIGKVYKEVAEFENSFLNRGKRDEETDNNQHAGRDQGRGQESGAAPDVVRPVTEMVGEEIPVTLEP